MRPLFPAPFPVDASSPSAAGLVVESVVVSAEGAGVPAVPVVELVVVIGAGVSTSAIPGLVDGTRELDGAGDGTMEPDGAGDGTTEPDGAGEGTREPDGAGDGESEPDGAMEGMEVGGALDGVPEKKWNGTVGVGVEWTVRAYTEQQEGLTSVPLYHGFRYSQLL